MTRRRSFRVGVSIVVVLGLLSLALSVAGTVFATWNSRLLGEAVDWSGLAWGLWPAAFVVVGAVVAVARPAVFVGWGLLTAGFAVEVGAFGGAYGGWAALSGRSAPMSDVAIWLGMVSGGVAATMVLQVVTRLPSGLPDTPIAQQTARVAWVLGTALVAWWAFSDEVLSINTMSGDAVHTPDLPNPVALIHTSRAVTSAVTGSLTLGLVLCFLWSVGLILNRRRRASVAERAQLRWLALGLLALPVVAGVTTVLANLVTIPQSVADILFVSLVVVGLGAIPVSIAVSVLKFRLFDIDRLISRTLAFAVVALVLGSCYAVLAVLPFTLVAGMSGGDTPSWVVASATLAVAVLFSPLRKRVRRVVDRRFNRSHYDAERVAERFASRVREFSDLGTITTDLGMAVQGALQPAMLAVWVRNP